MKEFARGLRPLVRIGSRTIRKAPLRSLLVFTLVALVVGVGTFAAIAARSTSSNSDDNRASQFGAGNFRADFGFGHHAGQEASFPPGFAIPVPFGVNTNGYTDEQLDDIAWFEQLDVNAAEREIEAASGVDVAIFRNSFLHDLSANQGPFGGSSSSLGSLTDIDPTHSAATGALMVNSGRLPLSNDEIAVPTRSSTDARLGDEIVVGDESLTIVGFVTDPANRWATASVITPAVFDRVVESGTASFVVLADIADNSDAAAQLASHIDAVVQRPITVQTPDLRFTFRNGNWFEYTTAPAFNLSASNTPPAFPVLISGLLGIQIMLVSAAAFAVGIRRRTKEFGQLMTVGADDRQIRRLAQVEAGLLGVTGALAGLVIGVGAAAAVVSGGLLDDAGERIPTGVRWSLIDWAGPALVGIAAVILAAWWPTRALARAPIPGTLEGRLPAVPVKGSTPRWGVVLVAGGILLIATSARALNNGTNSETSLLALMLLGVAAMIGGSILLIGTLLSVLGRRVDGFPLVARLAVRNSDRQRARSWVVVGAFIAALALPVLIGAATKAYPQNFGSSTTPEFEDRLILTTKLDFSSEAGSTSFDEEIAEFDASLTSRIAQTNPLVGSAPLTTAPFLELIEVRANNTSGYGGHMIAATPEMIALLGLDDDLANDLAQGAIVEVSAWLQSGRGEAFLTERPAYQRFLVDVIDGPELFSNPTWLIPPDLLEDMGSITEELGTIRILDEPLSDIDEDAIRQWGNEQWVARFGPVSFDDPFRIDGSADQDRVPILQMEVTRLYNSGPSARQVQLWALVASIGLALLVAMVTSSLSAVEMTGDIESMIATGAAPSIRRRLLGTQTLYHLLIAAMIAIPLALIAFWAVTSADGFRGTSGPTLPWLSIGMTAIGVPVVIALTIALTFRNGKPAVSRRLS